MSFDPSAVPEHRLDDLADTMFPTDPNRRLRDQAPLVYVLRSTSAVVCRTHADLPDAVSEELRTAVNRTRGRPSEWAQDYAAYIRILLRFGALLAVRAGPLYSFPADISQKNGVVAVTRSNEDLLRGGLDEWLPDVAAQLPMMAALAEGRAVSVCASVRASERLHCAGVETLGEVRALGHGRKVVESWGNAVRELGAEPIYATTFDNIPSQRLARALRLDLIGSEFSVECRCA